MDQAFLEAAMKKPLLDCFFKPKSVAVVGASRTAGTVGWFLVDHLKEGGFPGAIYPINPKYAEVQGLKAYPALGEVGASIDLAVIAIPIRDVPRAVKECGEAGIRGAIIVSVGGLEAGKAGKDIEDAIQEAAADAGVRYIGPNSMGVVSPYFQLRATLAHSAVPSGSLALISQSGALSFSILSWAARKNIGFSHFVSVGNMTDVDLGDLIDYLGNEEKARSIVIYMETLTRHRKFMSAARSVARVKPIIVVKAGRGKAGARAAASHTGAIAGEDAAYNAAFRRAGIIRVDTVGQLFDCAEALGKVKPPLGESLGIITNAGGAGVMAVDALGRWQMEPAAPSPEFLQKLDDFLPPHWSRGNPLDILGTATPETYLKAVHLALEATDFDGLAVILTPQALTDPTEVARSLVPEIKGRAKPVFAVWMGGEEVARGIQVLNDAGIPTFETPEQAVDTFMEMYFYSRHLELLQETPPRLTRELNVDALKARAFLEQCLTREQRVLTELESKAILSAYGIPVNPTVAAASAAEAARAAKELGYPVAMKVNSPDISHKSEVGGVRFNLKNEKEVQAAYHQLMEDVRAREPRAAILGVTVQTQEPEADCDLILGSKRDPDFGPLILFGQGGILAEVLEDWAVDLPPLNLLLARRLIQKTRIYRVLQGYRNIPPANMDLLAEIVVRVSQLVTDFPEIVELDINPLMFTGGRLVAVDARMVVEPSDVPAPRHLIISPYPNQYESYWMLRDGTPIILRPVKPEDEPLVEQLLKNCSEETIYFRYFRLIKKWTHDMLIRFTQNDYDREIGLMAIGQPPGPEVMMGVGRMVMDPDRDSAEFAVIVADPWQGKGLGPKLLERVIDIARENGVRLLYGEVLAQNQPMLEMVRRLGFTLKKDAEGQIVRAEMDLWAGRSR
jgi:acetyltransferase